MYQLFRCIFMNDNHSDLEVRRQFFKTHYKIFASKENMRDLELLEVFAFRVSVTSINHM